jgi:hypothetical protein
MHLQVLNFDRDKEVLYPAGSVAATNSGSPRMVILTRGWLQSSGHHPRSPFPSLAQTLSSRLTHTASDYGQARAARRIAASQTHPVMSASIRVFEVLSRGGWPAASLAATLMVSIVVFQAGDGTFGAVPADEIDGDEVQVLVEIDPWA